MIRIAAIGVLDSPREERIIRIFLLRVAAAFVLRGSRCYRDTIANGVPLSLALLFNEKYQACSCLPELL
jgi:hypothetical protein